MHHMGECFFIFLVWQSVLVKGDPKEWPKYRVPKNDFLYNAISTLTRQDLSTTISLLSERVLHPTQEDLEKLQWALGYQESTKMQKLRLAMTTPMTVRTYIDASLAVHSDFKSASAWESDDEVYPSCMDCRRSSRSHSLINQTSYQHLLWSLITVITQNRVTVPHYSNLRWSW